tara:strand:+ start:31 stop:168 length:138 start_codon:yes stop_codon:yes gene_type:complete
LIIIKKVDTYTQKKEHIRGAVVKQKVLKEVEVEVTEKSLVENQNE